MNQKFLLQESYTQTCKAAEKQSRMLSWFAPIVGV